LRAVIGGVRIEVIVIAILPFLVPGHVVNLGEMRSTNLQSSMRSKSHSLWPGLIHHDFSKLLHSTLDKVIQVDVFYFVEVNENWICCKQDEARVSMCAKLKAKML
jgi:hypothetical protein